MAEFASAWERRPAAYNVDVTNRGPLAGPAGIPGRPTGFPPNDKEFASDLEKDMSLDRDALYLLMQCQVPEGRDTLAQLTLRAWVLVRGLEMASGGSTADALLASMCHALRRAAYELPNGRWRRALEPLGAWTTTKQELSGYLVSCGKTLHAQGEQLRVIKQISRFAGGDTRPLDEESTDAHGRPVGMQSLFSASPLDGDEEDEHALADVAVHPSQASARLAREEEFDEENVAVNVDPDSSPYEQEIHVRAARLQLGAAARFLPWDWSKMAPPEVRAFDHLIIAALTAPPDERIRLLAALAWTGREAGLTLEECLQIPLKPLEPNLRDVEWRINLDQGLLKRRPPRRADHRKPTEKQRELLRPSASTIEIPIYLPARDSLVAAFRRRPLARLLGQLWFDDSRSPQTSFRQWVKSSAQCHRVQPSMVGRLLAQRSYESTGDHVLARLLPSTPASAIPASTVYTAYRESDLRMVWPEAVGLPKAPSGNLNVAGGLMDLEDDAFLEEGFWSARNNIESLGNEARWIEFHNAVACYWDAALRAATGVRPTNDLWTTDAVFDWHYQFVFVDDKASPVAGSGRLIPLPTSLCQAFRASYIENHLPWISSRLKVDEPTLGGPFPLLFLIESGRQGSKLTPVTNAQRSKTGIEGPLPLNIFRHRLRTRLHQIREIDREVVDSLMGHGDGATLTHGDFSMRTWQRDIDASRPVLERLYECFKIVPPSPWGAFEAIAPEVAPLQIGGPSFTRQETTKHGPSKSAAALRFIHKYLRELDFLAQKTEGEAQTPAQSTQKPSDTLLLRLSRLSSGELDVLSKRLVTRADNLPETTGALRYATFLKLGEALWTRHSLRLPIRRRYAARALEDSPFKQEAPGALSIHADMRAALDAEFAALPVKSRLSLAQALVLLLFDLCVTSRITHRALLESLLESEDSWRVIGLSERFYLEWSPDSDLTTERDKACMRFPISLRSAWLLSTVVAGKTRRSQAFEGANEHARSLALAMRVTHKTASGSDLGGTPLLDRARDIVAQCNIIELPGTVAGYLAGRVWTASLPWGEWIRVKQGRWTNTTSIPLTLQSGSQSKSGQPPEALSRYAEVGEEDESDEYVPSSATRLVRRKKPNGSPNTRSLAALAMVRQVSRGIKELKESKGLTKRREARAKRLSEHINNEAGQVSSTIRLLCLWAIDMLVRPGRTRKLATGSVIRYFAALSPTVLAVGCDVEIDVMDDEQIEAFYSTVMDISTVQNLRDTYVALRGFHHFAHGSAGLPEIDWSSIVTTQKLFFGAPGFIDEASYLELIDVLSQDEGCPSARPWHLQCFAILAYRFGLRGGEIAGLTRSDVVWNLTQIHVLVRRNRLRALKTGNARRIVPLLFELTPIEQRALQSLRDAQLSTDGNSDAAAPLFSMPGSPDTPLNDLAVRDYLNDVLKHLTGQPGLSCHDLRHSFAAYVWAATQPSGWTVFGQVIPKQNPNFLTDILVGFDATRITRRSPWAIANLMGHAHPQTAMTSYVHCVSDALEVLVDVNDVRTPSSVSPLSVTCPRLDLSTTYLRGNRAYHKGSSAPNPDSSNALVALRFISQGRTNEEVAQYTGLTTSDVQELRETSLELFEELAKTNRGGLKKHVSDVPDRRRLANDGLLALVRAASFDRLQEGLASLSSTQRAELAGLDRITPEQWRGMIGERREISMWIPNQLSLFGLAVRHLAPNPGTLEMVVPKTKGLSADDEEYLRRLAQSTGWLPSISASKMTSHAGPPLCATLGTAPALPAVRLTKSGMRVDRRVVLLFGGSAEGFVRNRLELLVCALCMNLFTRRPI